MATIKCPYCGNDTILVNGTTTYPHRKDLYDHKFWMCHPCNAFVGTKRDKQNTPLGSLANPHLRKLRSKAHKLFDPLWQSKAITRTEAYKLLATKLGLKPKNCHIGMFNVETCELVIKLLEPDKALL